MKLLQNLVFIIVVDVAFVWSFVAVVVVCCEMKCIYNKGEKEILSIGFLSLIAMLTV